MKYRYTSVIGVCVGKVANDSRGMNIVVFAAISMPYATSFCVHQEHGLKSVTFFVLFLHIKRINQAVVYIIL